MMTALLKVLVFIALVANNEAAVEYTNIICSSMDKSFSDFEYCYLKSVNRTYKYMSLKVKLYKVPITNVMICWAFLKRANGYKSFIDNYNNMRILIFYILMLFCSQNLQTLETIVSPVKNGVDKHRRNNHR